MSWLQPKLHLRVAQKQILTPGLVQMVSVLALNRLELREMINQEMIENPVLEELSEESVTPEDYSAETFLKAETETKAAELSVDLLGAFESRRDVRKNILTPHVLDELGLLQQTFRLFARAAEQQSPAAFLQASGEFFESV